MPDNQNADHSEDIESGEEPTADSHANRAARRARGKGTSQQPVGRSQFTGRRNPIQGPRQWAARRSG